MVVFNDLRINASKTQIFIDIDIDNLVVYSGMYIKYVYLYHYKNTSSIGEPIDTNKVLTVYENTNDDTTVRSLRKCVNVSAFINGDYGVTKFDKEIFFVKVVCDGTMTPDISNYACGSDDVVDIACIIDWRSLYQYGMRLIAAMNGCDKFCKSNAELEQFILLWYSIRLAISACDFDQLFLLWDRFQVLVSVTMKLTSIRMNY